MPASGLIRLYVLVVFSMLLSGSCSTQDQPVQSGPGPSAGTEQQAAADTAAPAGWLQGLPEDRLQPWEQTSAARQASALEAGSGFTPGVERFNEAGDVLDLAEASRLQSGPVDAGGLAYALFRLPFGTDQPGALAFDVNLQPRSDGSPSEYYVGLSDYASGRWEWHGPFGEHHVRLARGSSPAQGMMASSDYTSVPGNLFAAVLVHDGSRCDLLGITSDPLDPADVSAPPVPTGLTATPVAGGLSLQWNDVIAADLAGYRIFHSGSSFISPAAAGVKTAGYLEGSTRHLLAGLSAKTSVRIATVDCSGNQSALSEPVSATPLPGSIPDLELELAQPSVLRDETLLLSIGSPDSGLLFDCDLDGDGSFELSAQPAGQYPVDTTAAGLIRPRVRASDAAAERMALGGVSLLVAGNSRPVAFGSASPQSGTVPLLVDLDGTASTDFDGSIVGGGWDFDGDGLFDLFSEDDTDSLAGQFLYETAGLYNARLRVIDDRGSWDLDTLGIFVSEPGTNLPPQLDFLQASPQTAQTGQSVNFTAQASDPDGAISMLEWDFDNDGSTDATGSPAAHAFGTAGIFNVRLRVTDDDGSAVTDHIAVLVQDDPLDPAPVALLAALEHDLLIGTGASSLQQQLDASASYDPGGGSLQYAFDQFGTGSFGSFGSSAQSNFYTFDQPGTYFPAVRVMDESGRIAEASTHVQVRRISPQIIESGFTFDNTTAICSADSDTYERLGIAYYDSVNDDLRFMVSSDSSGLSWLPSYVVDANGGEWMSLAQNLSQFYLAYYRDGDLFLRASQNDGQSFNLSGTIDNSADDAGDFCSCVYYAGSPAVAYYNTTDGDLYFCRSTNLGVNWSAPVVVDGTGDTGQYCSLQVLNGVPAIAYYRVDTGNLMFARATSGSGASWNTPEILDASANDVGRFASMAVIRNDANQTRPAVAYYDATSANLKYVLADDANGLNWQAPKDVVSTGTVNQISLLQADGHILIGFSRVAGASIFFIQSEDRTGVGDWGAVRTIEGINAGAFASFTLRGDGQPAAAYYDSSKQLHFATSRLD